MTHFVCFYCDGFDNLGWRGTRTVKVTAATPETAKVLAFEKVQREIIRVVEVGA
jgi:hypothetical protein